MSFNKWAQANRPSTTTNRGGSTKERLEQQRENNRLMDKRESIFDAYKPKS